MTPLVLLHLSLRSDPAPLNQVAKGLGVSAGLLSMVLNGQRKPSADLGRRIRARTQVSPSLAPFLLLQNRLEGQLRRGLSEEEMIALIGHLRPGSNQPLGLFGDILNRLDQQHWGAELHKEASPGSDFEVATALSGLAALAEILVEEPDLPADQRRQFQQGIQAEAAKLKSLLQPDDSQTPIQAPVFSDRPDRFVDRVFLAQGYYFPELEGEADLIVRRARRHGPLGTFALVTRLEVDLGRSVTWLEGGGMAPSSVGHAAAGEGGIELDPSLGQAQLRFRLAQFLAAQEARGLLDKLVAASDPPNEACALALRKALIAYLAAAMFMPYEAFLKAVQDQRYDIDWLARHFGCSFDQVCHRLIALRQPGNAGVPLGMLRVSPAGHTITRIALPGLALPDRQAACPLWAAYRALQRRGESITQLAEFPDGERFLFVGRTAAGPRAHHGQARRLTSVMLACDWAYADALIYADAHDPARAASVTHVGSACETCTRTSCESRVAEN